ncbi:inter-alpha-trypsin inhibitor heavy chain H4-like isoform X11 [Terrapene carolina triunguis]|uniref:inter-alpha-trypsin inhibitor heavy chain H4-like isoform X11 n=1 Tax=Terrapene triunguis TaxID=2587831 RepID=UPI000E77ED11|nr:inter-alpha-trypsin inhibitor heavy chain H4-like isoform X11 [Terrapene carolina triunguis]
MEERAFVALLVISSLIVLAENTDHKNAIEIYSLHVESTVTSRFAHTVITSRLVNKVNESQEAVFEVELPKTAFITNFSMSIDGETYPGTIKEKASAQEQYDIAVSHGQSAGLVKTTGRKLEQFHVSVNVASDSKVTFELIYEELLKRQLGRYELLFKVRPKQLVKHFQIDVHIFEPQGINFLETDSTFMTNELTEALTKVQNETKAHILFKPTIVQQKKSPELEETLLDGDFIIRYDVKRSVSAGDIQIVNGYFVHYFAPNEMPTFPKNVIFVVDQSGSMSGRKIEQTRDALLKILEDLRPEDHFSLITFNSLVTEWKNTLLQATGQNVESAKRYVKTVMARGGTDINNALLTAANTLDKANYAEILQAHSISMIILLTDGQPTVGVQDVEIIQQNIQKAIKGKYVLYCLGFGFDVSYKFLEKMALDNGGIARRIYEDSDSDLQLQSFYQEVATPILKDIEIQYPENSILELTQNSFKLFFDGSEIVVAGRIDNELDVLPVEIQAQSHTSNLIFKEEANVREKEKVFQHQKYIFGNFIERLWAYLTIQQLLEKSISAQEEQQKNMQVARALELSMKYSFVTPLTSMVVTKPDDQQKLQLANKPAESDNEKSRFTGFSVRSDRYFLVSQARDYIQRVPKTVFRTVQTTPQLLTNEYPHFLFQLPRQNDVICLNIDGQPQAYINLISDRAKGISVTGKLGRNRNHFVLFEITNLDPHVQLHVSKEGTVLSYGGHTTKLPWKKSASSTIQGLKIAVEKERSLTMSASDNITIKIAFVKSPNRFLGLYFMDTDHFSDKASGLLGQFYFDTHLESNPGASQGEDERVLSVHGQKHRVTRKYKKDYRLESATGTISCWSLYITP